MNGDNTGQAVIEKIKAIVSKLVPVPPYSSIAIVSTQDSVNLNKTLQLSTIGYINDATTDISDQGEWSVINGTGRATIDQMGLLIPIEAGTVNVQVSYGGYTALKEIAIKSIEPALRLVLEWSNTVSIPEGRDYCGECMHLSVTENGIYNDYDMISGIYGYIELVIDTLNSSPSTLNYKVQCDDDGGEADYCGADVTLKIYRDGNLVRTSTEQAKNYYEDFLSSSINYP